MTKLAQRRTKLTFESADEVREAGKYRAVTIEATPYIAVVRLKGTRRSFQISWAAVFHAAAKLEANRLIAEKKARKK